MGKSEVSMKLKLSYGIGEVSDMIAYQGFSFLIFTFYASVLKVSVFAVTLVFIVWSIYNSLNDPILGAISDRTKTRRFGGGRRRPWIVSMIIPLAAVMYLLFTPPIGNMAYTALYMFMIMCVFDTFYTAYSLNHTSLYPEMFSTNKAREEAGAVRRILMVVGLVVAFVVPSIFISDLTGNADQALTIRQYQTTGIVFGILIAITVIIHVLWGIKEPPYEKIEKKKTLGFIDSFKVTLKNKKFIIFVFASTMNWYVFGLLPMIMAVYGTCVLGLQGNSLAISALLLVAFLCSIPGVIIWSKVDGKVGSRKGFMIAMACWAIFMLPFLFIRSYPLALINMAFAGIGFGGAPYFIDRNISNIVDDDEFKTNQRREASYYGVHALFIRLATIIQIVTVALVVSTVGWTIIDVTNVTPQIIFGLQMLMSIFPAGTLIIGIVILKFFPLTKKVVDEIQRKKKELNIVAPE